MKNLILCSLLLSVSFVLRAETIVCEGDSHLTKSVSVTIENSWPSKNTVITVDADFLSQPRVFDEVVGSNGLHTAPGLALHFKDHYGCIREAVMITELNDLLGVGYMDVYKLKNCRGGSTPDDICLGENK